MHPDPAGEGAPHGTHSASVPGWDGRGLRSALVGVQGSSRAIAALTPGCKTRRPYVDGWVASAFRRSGHRTAAVGNWHLGMRWLDKGGDRFHAEGGFRPGDDVDYTSELRGSPLDVGFDRFFGILASLDMSPIAS